MTGLMRARLTTSSSLTGFNLGFYYHVDNQTPDGQWLVFRALHGSDFGNTVNAAYHVVHLETGETYQVTPSGTAESGFVRGNWLYVSHRASTATACFDSIRRYRLDPPPGPQQNPTSPRFACEEIVTFACPSEGGTGGLSVLTVNSDGHEIIYQRSTVTGATDTRSFRVHRKVGALDEELISDPRETGERGLDHFQSHPTNPAWYTYFDHEGDSKECSQGRALATIGVGRTDTKRHGKLESFDPYFYGRCLYFFHPFYAGDGHLWTDAVLDPWQELKNVRFTLTDAGPPDPGPPNGVTDTRKVTASLNDWQVHTSRTRTAEWFVGDGPWVVAPGQRYPENAPGRSFIHLLRFDVANDQTSRYELAALGTYPDPDQTGEQGPNAHIVETQDAVVYAGGPETIDNLPRRDIFKVQLPAAAKARLRDGTVSGSAEGPFKHANRVLARKDDGGWSVTYGLREHFGDDVVDRSVDAITTTAGVYQDFALADLNGDSVDDRIAMRWGATYTGEPGPVWTIVTAYSRSDGLLDGTDNWPDNAVSFTGIQSRPPVFGNLNGDGQDDVVIVGASGTALSWRGYVTGRYMPEGPPSAGFGESYFGDASLDLHALVGDVNGDGYADRVVVRRYGANQDVWHWIASYGAGTSWGPGAVNTEFVGGDSGTDRPLIKDVNGDGFADIVVVRSNTNGMFGWYVNLSSAAGFGTQWHWEPSVFGTNNGQNVPLLGTLARFTTRQR